MSQPHVGEELASTIIAECGLELEQRCGRMEDKHSPVRMSSYAGLNPRKQSRADKQTSRRKGIAGNRFLRAMAIEAGQSALRSAKSREEDPGGFRAKQLAARNGGQHHRDAYKSAVSAAARRIMEASDGIICKGEAYNSSQDDFDRVKTNKVKKVKDILRKVEDVKQDRTPHELDTGVRDSVNRIITTLKHVIGNENLYRLAKCAEDKQVTVTSFGKRVKTLLDKYDMTHSSQLGFLIQQNTLKEIKGLGDKMYSTIIQGLLAENFIEVGQ